MYARLLGAMLALALLTYPAHAMQSRSSSANNALATCVLSLIVIGLPLGCKGAKRTRVDAAIPAKGQVTIHRPVSGQCQNGNTYRVMRVADPEHVCKNSFKRGSSVPACTNISGKNGNAHSIIILGKSDRWLAHEIRHACDVNLRG